MTLAQPERTYARRLTPDEVVALGRGDRISHLRDDAVVSAIRRCALGNRGQELFREARHRGFLVLPDGSHLTQTCGQLGVIWAWWCVAAMVPEATIDLRMRERTGGARVRIDLSPTGRAFAPSVLLPLGQIWIDYVSSPEASWIVTPDVVEFRTPAFEDAKTMVDAVLALATREQWLAPATIDHRDYGAG